MYPLSGQVSIKAKIERFGPEPHFASIDFTSSFKITLQDEEEASPKNKNEEENKTRNSPSIANCQGR